MFEKFFLPITAQLFLVNGTSLGEIQLLNTAGFKVKMQVFIGSTTQPSLTLEVKRVLSSTLMVVGPVATSIDKRSDLSAYLVADNAAISSNLQARGGIPLNDIQRAVYSEEPTVAIRTIDVDQFGEPTHGQMVLANPLILEPFDAISAAYPAVDTEVYSYYDGGLGGVLVGTVTVIYTDASKESVSSVVRS